MKYKLIKNFLTQEEINLCTDYCRIQHRLNKFNFDNQNSNFDSSFYGDPLMESMLLNKRKLVEKHSKLELLPTYSYFRVYTYKSDLPKHTDRPSCEISITVHINSDGTPWEIYIDGKKYRTKPGDAVLYKGCEVEHWREPFEGDWHAQAFLHYVNSKGPHKNLYRDQRRMWGEKK